MLFVGVLLLTANSLQANDSKESGFEKIRRDFNFSNGTSAVSVYDISNGRELFSANARIPLKPASILKILTSQVAFAELGAEYRFRTELFASELRSGYVDTLVVRGRGDPTFTTEDMWVLARRVKGRGIKSVGTLILDDSAFVDPKPRSGQRAYEAGSSALALNHNSLMIDICPTQSGQPARLSAEPWEAGFVIKGSVTTSGRGRDTYFIEETRGSLLQAFEARGNISSGGECREIYRSVANPTDYFGRVLQAFLRYLDVQIVNGSKPGLKQGYLWKVYEHESKPLNQIIRDLNHYSSNFIAEQVLSTLGCGLQEVCTRGQGLKLISSYLQKRGYSPDQFQIADGSGLSHDNKVTAEIILRTLIELYRNNTFGPEFLLSLPVGERSGTLQKRKFGNQIVVRAKTGTLTGVNSLAGYLKTKSGKELAFVSIQNKVSSAAAAHAREQFLVKTLYEN